MPSAHDSEVDAWLFSTWSWSLSARHGYRETPPVFLSCSQPSWRPVSILCTYAWGPVSQISVSRGESTTRCSAMVSSTTPRLGPRCPPVRETEATSSLRISAARGASWSAPSRLRSAGPRIDRNTVTDPAYERQPAPASWWRSVAAARAGDLHRTGEAHQVAPVTLRCVERCVRGVQHLFEGGAVVRDRGAPHGDGQTRDAEVAIRGADRDHELRDTFAEALGDGAHLGVPVRSGSEIGQQHHELLTAEPADDVLLATQVAQLRRHRGQHLDVCEVSVGDDHQLEVVEIEDQHGGRAARAVHA